MTRAHQRADRERRDDQQTDTAAFLNKNEPRWYIGYSRYRQRLYALPLWWAPPGLMLEADTAQDLTEAIRTEEMNGHIAAAPAAAPVTAVPVAAAPADHRGGQDVENRQPPGGSRSSSSSSPPNAWPPRSPQWRRP